MQTVSLYGIWHQYRANVFSCAERSIILTWHWHHIDSFKSLEYYSNDFNLPIRCQSPPKPRNFPLLESLPGDCSGGCWCLGESVEGRDVRCTWLLNRLQAVVGVRHGTGSLGQWVIWVIFHIRVTGSLGHHSDPVWDPSFSGFRKNAQNAKRTFKMLKWQ